VSYIKININNGEASTDLWTMERYP